MTKSFVIDTNVLMADPEAIFKFEDNHIILPMAVIEELDAHKKDQNEVGRNARQVSRNLKECRKLGSLHKGVTLKNGGTLKVEVAYKQTLDRLPLDLNEDIKDNRILAVAIHNKAILVTNDSNLAIKAESLGLIAEEYENTKVSVDKLYTGTGVGYISGTALDIVYETGVLDRASVDFAGAPEPLANQCYILKSTSNPKQSALVTYNAIMGRFELLPQDLKTMGLFPKNSEQQFALSLLLNPDVALVSLIGLAGSGKTLCALAAGLHGVIEDRCYKKVLLLKPIVAMDNGHQLGFLPGSMEEKLAPWMASYYDNIDFIMNESTRQDTPIKVKAPRKAAKESTKFSAQAASVYEKDQAKIPLAEELIAAQKLEIGSLEHIRGRSLPNQYIIIDEAQNMSANAIKTVITRAGEGTKIVLLGDIEQIDSPYLDASSNGLSYVADRLKNSPLCAHITLTRSERSELAELAAKLL